MGADAAEGREDTRRIHPELEVANPQEHDARPHGRRRRHVRGRVKDARRAAQIVEHEPDVGHHAARHLEVASHGVRAGGEEIDALALL